MSTKPQSKFTPAQFPFKSRSAIEHKAKDILSQFSSAFSFSSSTAPATTPDSEINRLREDLVALEEGIYGQQLQVLTLHHALKEAKATYCSLKMERQRVLKRINHVALALRKPPALPVEILEMICSYSCKSYSPEAEKSWGRIIYKSVPVHTTLRNLASDQVQLIIENGGTLCVEETFTYGMGYTGRPKSFGWKSLEPLGMWKSLKLCIPSGVSGDALCASIARRCASSLSTVEQFELTNDSRMELDPDDFEESLGALILPACTSLRVPLDLVHCFEDLIPNLLHLGISFFATWDFTSQFEGINLDNIRSLEFDIGDEHCRQYEYALSRFGDPILFPNLQRFTIRLDEFTGVSTILSILGCIQNQKLQRLEFFCGIMVDDDTDMRNLLLGIDSCYKSLAWISFHPKDTREFTLPALDGLQMMRKPEGAAILSNLEQLSISIKLCDFEETILSLVGMLQSRREANTPILAVELHLIVARPAPVLKNWQQLLVDYLGVFVKDVWVIWEEREVVDE